MLTIGSMEMKFGWGVRASLNVNPGRVLILNWREYESNT